MKIVAKYTKGPDGLFHCDVEGCEQPGYEHPQHLGLHRYHKHGIKDPNRKSRAKPRVAKAKTSNGDGPWTAEVICFTILAEVSNGTIPIGAIEDYQAWVAATKNFLAKLT